MFVSTIYSLVVGWEWDSGIWETKTSNKSMGEIAEGGPIRVNTPTCTCGPVLKWKHMWQIREYNQDHSVTRDGAVINCELHVVFFPSQRVRASASLFSRSGFLLAI